jgi:NAD(P)-dependent dehydrogenase (short-subunit alcohol dehydrogenase family)
MSKVWLITGAGRGMGVDIANAALAAGHAVVATGRNPAGVSKAIRKADNLLTTKLDITRPEEADGAVAAAVERFGRIDVLVNNAGNFYAGFFEGISPEDFRAQVETNFFGPVNVTRAVLPVMRSQRSGLVVTISSTAGISGQELQVRILSGVFSFAETRHCRRIFSIFFPFASSSISLSK